MDKFIRSSSEIGKLQSTNHSPWFGPCSIVDFAFMGLPFALSVVEDAKCIATGNPAKFGTT